MTQFSNFINGAWLPSAHTSTNINPSDNADIVGEYAQADATQANEAVIRAKARRKLWEVGTLVRTPIVP